LEADPADGHVAPGNVLRFLIGNENVSGIARCIGNAFGDTSIAGRGDVRAANRRMRRAEQGGSEVGEPVWVGGGSVVDIGDDLPARRLKPVIRALPRPRLSVAINR